MKDAGFGGDSSRDLLISTLILSIIIAASNFLGTLLSNKMGRREIILMVTIPMGICLFILDAAMIINILSPGGKCNLLILIIIVGGWLCLISLAMFLIFFCIGFAT